MPTFASRGRRSDTRRALVAVRGYNGWRVAELAGPTGMRRLGAETIPQIVTRGLLVDVSDRTPGAGEVITLADVEDLAPEPGDAVLFHTGWGARWNDPEAY